MGWFFLPFDAEHEIELPGGPLTDEDYKVLGRPEDQGAAMLQAVAQELVEIRKWAELMRKAVQGVLNEITRSGRGHEVLDREAEGVEVISPPEPAGVEETMESLRQSVGQTQKSTSQARGRKEGRK